MMGATAQKEVGRGDAYEWVDCGYFFGRTQCYAMMGWLGLEGRNYAKVPELCSLRGPPAD
jgi:hypothetical protein